MDERDFFNRLAPTWDANEILSTPRHVRHILSRTGIKTSDRVLDLGTGTGVLLPAIAELTGPAGVITAVDYSTGMLDIARSKFSRLVPVPEFMCMDFETETIPGEYNHILLYCVYPHSRRHTKMAPRSKSRRRRHDHNRFPHRRTFYQLRTPSQAFRKRSATPGLQTRRMAAYQRA